MSPAAETRISLELESRREVTWVETRDTDIQLPARHVFRVLYIRELESNGDNWLTRGNRNAASCSISIAFRGKTYDLRRTYNLKCTKIPNGYDVSTTSRILKVARLVSNWEFSILQKMKTLLIFCTK